VHNWQSICLINAPTVFKKLSYESPIKQACFNVILRQIFTMHIASSGVVIQFINFIV
jgi:hypothetical protein